MPRFGFLPATDRRVESTIEAIRRELLVDGLVARYRTSDRETGAVDGLPGTEGAFLPCTFWLIDDLALIGRVDDARVMFERLLGLCNDIGLYAEEYDPRAGRMVGNYPQAFTHVALVNSARNLTRQLKHPA
jgi:GH15 family glucan-1,4-alpha-glucosidase